MAVNFFKGTDANRKQLVNVVAQIEAGNKNVKAWGSTVVVKQAVNHVQISAADQAQLRLAGAYMKRPVAGTVPFLSLVGDVVTKDGTTLRQVMTITKANSSYFPQQSKSWVVRLGDRVIGFVESGKFVGPEEARYCDLMSNQLSSVLPITLITVVGSGEGVTALKYIQGGPSS